MTHFDRRGLNPSGLRFGTTWTAQRGLGPEDMARLAAVIGEVLGSMRSFTIRTGVGSVGRVRLPASVLREARKTVSSLLTRDVAWSSISAVGARNLSLVNAFAF